MKTIFINLKVTLNKGVTPKEGEPINKEIRECISQGKPVVLDFEGVELMTTAFLNVVIGDLYKDYTSEQLKELISFKHLTTLDASRIKNVTDTAKLFYKDEEKFKQSVNSILDGDNK